MNIQYPLDPDTSNAEVVLADLAATARCNYRKSAEAWLTAAQAVADARKVCRFGQWADWLTQAGIPARTATRMIQFVRAGVQIGQLADLGKTEIAGIIAEAHAVTDAGIADCREDQALPPDDPGRVWRDRHWLAEKQLQAQRWDFAAALIEAHTQGGANLN